MTENMRWLLETQLKALNREIERQKILDRLAKIRVHPRNMHRRAELEKALKAL